MAASISSRLIALLTLCAVVTLGAGILLDYRLSRAEIMQRLETESQDTIQGVLDDLENLLDGVEDSTLFLGRVLEQREYSRQGLTQLVRELVNCLAPVVEHAVVTTAIRAMRIRRVSFMGISGSCGAEREKSITHSTTRARANSPT